MTSRARLFSLYARREAVQIAAFGRSVTQAASEHDEAKALGARLQQMALDIQIEVGPVSAATLRASGLLATSLVEEAERQSSRAAHAQHEVARLRVTIGCHDRRRQFGEAAATNARSAILDAAEAREESSRPAFRKER